MNIYRQSSRLNRTGNNLNKLAAHTPRCIFKKFLSGIVFLAAFLFITIPGESADDLPEKFDLRDVDGHSYLSPIKNQNPLGTCYAFGAVAAGESTYNRVVPRLKIKWLHEFLPESEDLSSRFRGTVPEFDVPGRDLPENAAVVEASLAARFSDSVRAAVGYGFRAAEGNRETAHSLNGELRIMF
jgi:hypothetical protein